MKKKEFTTKRISDNFTIAKTKLFGLDIEAAIKTLDLKSVVAVFKNYDIAHFQDAIEFLEDLGKVFIEWKKEGQGSVLIGTVKTCKSRCIFCEFGKDVTVYEFHYKNNTAPEPLNYKNNTAPEPLNRVHYSKNFGVFLDVRNNILHDMRVCNAFLSKSEIEVLNTKN